VLCTCQQELGNLGCMCLSRTDYRCSGICGCSGGGSWLHESCSWGSPGKAVRCSELVAGPPCRKRGPAFIGRHSASAPSDMVIQHKPVTDAMQYVAQGCTKCIECVLAGSEQWLSHVGREHTCSACQCEAPSLS
jgi:hypothetical protein